MESKAVLRQQCRQKAAMLPRFGAEFCAQLCNLPAYQTAKTVFCFVGTQQEIDTSAILQKVLDDKKILCVPYCKAKGSMEAKQIAEIAALQPGAYGIFAPSQDAPALLPAAIDLALLPCVAADVYGNRLGYGGGYYDRYLPQLSACCVTAVLCRSAMLLPALPHEAHDIPAQLVLTEQGIKI